MTDTKPNGGDVPALRIMNLERDVAAVIAGHREILSRIESTQTAELARHNEAMRVINELRLHVEHVRSGVTELAGSIESLVGIVERRKGKR